jgi:hypothetical protein
MSQTTTTQGEYTRDPHDRDPYRRKVQQTSSDRVERKRPRIPPQRRHRMPPQRRRIIPFNRHPLVIISALWTLIGVFLAGLMFHHLAFFVIISGAVAIVLLVIYPPRCSYCGAYIFRGIHVCANQPPVPKPVSGSATVEVGRSQREMMLHRWYVRIIQFLIVVNGILFFALLSYLATIITS